MSNRKATDTFPRCPNTDARGVCMYIGPCMSCYLARTEQERAAARVTAASWSPYPVREALDGDAVVEERTVKRIAAWLFEHAAPYHNSPLNEDRRVARELEEKARGLLAGHWRKP